MRFKKYKWLFYWIVFALMIGVLIFISFYFKDTIWIGNAIQTFGIVIGVYGSLLVFLKSKEDGDIQFREHLEHLQKLNTKEIEALQRATEKQIEALHQSTYRQISSFEQQTKEIANKLSENSILLAEILGKELERAISESTAMMEKAERDYSKLQGFQLFRTEKEKKDQLEKQKGIISILKQWIDFWSTKYERLKNYFGFNEKLLG